MNISNHPTLENLREMTAEAIESLPLDYVALLAEAIAERKADTKFLDDKLNTALLNRYDEPVTALRRAQNKDTGRISVEQDEWVIRHDRPKKVEWSQPLLKRAMDVIVNEWQQDPADYLLIRLDVSEAKYNAWPPMIRQVFEPARTVNAGKANVTIERSKKGGE